MSQCTKTITHSNVKVEENGRKAVFRNKENKDYAVTTVDGCLINDGPRSDYIVSEVGKCSVLVELKGKDVNHACDQLFTTADHDSVKGILQNRVGFLVVCSRYPKFDSFIAKAKHKAMKKYKAGFHVVCDKGEFDISRVVEIDGPF